ncbi:MAG: hypothetical protein ABIL58_27955 [Pseudomonadota bacterium]
MAHYKVLRSSCRTRSGIRNDKNAATRAFGGFIRVCGVGLLCELLPVSLSGNDFQVLDALDSGDISTQRQLSDHTGISLGQINFDVVLLFDADAESLDGISKETGLSREKLKMLW